MTEITGIREILGVFYEACYPGLVSNDSVYIYNIAVNNGNYFYFIEYSHSELKHILREDLDNGYCLLSSIDKIINLDDFIK